MNCMVCRNIYIKKETLVVYWKKARFCSSRPYGHFNRSFQYEFSKTLRWKSLFLICTFLCSYNTGIPFFAKKSHCKNQPSHYRRLFAITKKNHFQYLYYCCRVTAKCKKKLSGKTFILVKINQAVPYKWTGMSQVFIASKVINIRGFSTSNFPT